MRSGLCRIGKAIHVVVSEPESEDLSVVEVKKDGTRRKIAGLPYIYKYAGAVGGARLYFVPLAGNGPIVEVEPKTGATRTCALPRRPMAAVIDGATLIVVTKGEHADSSSIYAVQ